jgi:subtilisin family serine protease
MKRLLLTTTILANALALWLFCAPALHAQPHEPTGAKLKFRRVERYLKDKYIVVLKEDVVAEGTPSTPEAVAEHITLTANEMVSVHRGKIRHTFHSALKGFAAEMSEAEAERLSHDPRVEFVEEDSLMSGDAHTSQNAAPWGLDRIDQRSLPLNNIYSYSGSGFGVNAYVIDSGIRATHQEFGGRASSVRDFVGTDGNDCNGHGTHVAATLGGRTFGVAKDVRIYSLRVFGCGNTGSTSDIIAAVDWVRVNRVKPAVTNMSLGGSTSDALDQAVRNLITAGVPVVVAAGNDNKDASQHSPARVQEAITVGATDNTDTRPTNWQCSGTMVFTCGSNFGTVVDVFAPGQSITAAGIASDTDTAVKSGTSMATPHVAGMVARYLETDPYAAPSAVASLITRNATNGVVQNPGTGSPNRLLYTIPPRPMESRRYGDFNGDGKADILVQSAWGIGILTYDGASLTSLMLAPTGTWFGGWHYNSVGDHIVAIADFNGDGKDDILITSAWGIGILTWDGTSLSSLMLAPNETSFGGWRFQSGVNRIVGTADFNGDGKDDILITSAWGIGILTLDRSTLTSLMLAPSETWFGGWRFQSALNSIEGFGDFNADGKDDILIRSAWGMGILTLQGTTLTSLMVAPDGIKFGSWTFNTKTGRIAGIGRFNGGPNDQILITSDSGLAILGRRTPDASELTTLTMASNGTSLGGWLLDTRVNFIGRIGDVNGSFQDDIIIRSGWGIGILTLNGSTLTTLMLAPNGTRFGGWLYNSADDQILGVGSFAGLFTISDILISSGWGIGILSYHSSTLQSLMLAPNGTRFGGWLFDSTVNQVGIYGDIN